MAYLSSETPSLKAITINGAICVESQEDAQAREQRRKNRKSRWGGSAGASSSVFVPPKKKSHILLPEDGQKSQSTHASGLPSQKVADNSALMSSSVAPSTGRLLPTTIDASKMDEKSQQAYFLKLEIQEVTNRLERKDLGIPTNPRERSPSPEPIYNSKGVRINTREERTRNKLINQRNNAITKLKALDPTYKPPSSFKYKNTQLEDRVLIPAQEYPHINFMGALLGPRGNFLEELKAKTKCNIIIRGKGSLRAGMTGITKDGRQLDALDEPLHALVTAATAEDVKKGVKEVQDVIDMYVYRPDCEKAVALRAKHMHELSVLNGTLKDIDLKCLNCGRPGHKSWECDDSKIFTASVICSACGGVGHVTADCRQRRPGDSFNRKGKSAKPEVLDAEYVAFLKDMGEKIPGEDHVKAEPYVPPMGDLSRSLNTRAPLMLTHGGGAPGAASAQARALTSSQQTAGGMLQTMGTSIFGGKLTRLTSGYKSHAEMEMERKKKVEEFNNRPVPLEWQVQRYEQAADKRQEAYLADLERQAEAARHQKRQLAAGIGGAPPLAPPGSTSQGPASANDDLPQIVGAPLANLRRTE